jgi:hypothetical protein
MVKPCGSDPLRNKRSDALHVVSLSFPRKARIQTFSDARLDARIQPVGLGFLDRNRTCCENGETKSRLSH